VSVDGVPFPLMVDYEYQRLTLPRGTSRNAAQRLLTDAAEHGHWELDRLRLFPDGTRNVVLRRRYLKVQPTLGRELVSR
jgi:hypothetical protein